MTIISKCKSDFFILDDGTKVKELELLKTFIKKYYDKAVILSLKDIAAKLYLSLSKMSADEQIVLLGIGEGGSIVANYISEYSQHRINVINTKWSRKWISRYDYTFVNGNIELAEYEKKEIILVEDVVATGETVKEFNNSIKKNGIKPSGICTAILSENCNSNIFEQFEFTLIGVLASSNSNNTNPKEPYWYPPIYSLRHLLYGEEEQSFFYELLYEKYKIPMSEIRQIVTLIK